MSTPTTVQQPAQPTASDFVASLIRTYVPGLAGLVLGWILTLHLPFHVEGLGQGTVEAALSAAIAGAWYLLVRALETKWPALGVFLGVPKPPQYTPPVVTAKVDGGEVTFVVEPPAFTAEQLAIAASQPASDPAPAAADVAAPAGQTVQPI